jgi:hypothetical protein
MTNNEKLLQLRVETARAWFERMIASVGNMPDNDYAQGAGIAYADALKHIELIEHELKMIKAHAAYKADTYAVRFTPRADAPYHMGTFQSRAEAEAYANRARGMVDDFTQDVEAEVVELTPARF